jgi:hypothetical protein
MKKFLLVFVILAVVAGGAFAQFALEGGINTDFTESPLPMIGMAFGLDKMDILAGLTFGYGSYKVDVGGYYGGSTTVSVWRYGMYGGIGLKLVSSGPWTLTLPILMFINFNGSSAYNKISYGVDIGAGPRAYYALSDKWALFTGIFANVLEFESFIGDTTWGFFGSASVQLGIKYSFGKSN